MTQKVNYVSKLNQKKYRLGELICFASAKGFKNVLIYLFRRIFRSKTTKNRIRPIPTFVLPIPTFRPETNTEHFRKKIRLDTSPKFSRIVAELLLSDGPPSRFAMQVLRRHRIRHALSCSKTCLFTYFDAYCARIPRKHFLSQFDYFLSQFDHF